MEIGKRVSEIRKKLRITQKALAERAGVSQSTISDLESTERDISVSLLVKICDALSISVPEFLSSDFSSNDFVPQKYAHLLRSLSAHQLSVIEQLIELIISQEKLE